jgi:hypothetical protein
MKYFISLKEFISVVCYTLNNYIFIFKNNDFRVNVTITWKNYNTSSLETIYIKSFNDVIILLYQVASVHQC